jgi:hypothetical protein
MDQSSWINHHGSTIIDQPSWINHHWSKIMDQPHTILSLVLKLYRQYC